MMNGAIYGPKNGYHYCMAPTATNLRLRLPKALAERVRELADEQGVSINTLLVALVAGSVSFDLRPDPEPTDQPTKEAPAPLTRPRARPQREGTPNAARAD